MEWSWKLVFIWGFVLVTLRISHQAANVAPSGVAAQSSLWDPLYLPSVVIDDKPDSHFASKSCCASLFEDNPWWRVDLRGLHEIDQIQVTRRSDCCSSELEGAEIRIGTSLANNGNNNPRCGVISVTSAINMTFDCSQMRGYYVNILIPGVDRRLQLCEVRVYASAYMEAANVARGGVAVQSSLWSRAYPASLAIDGKSITYYHGSGSCISTLNENNPWWRLDLRGSYNVKLIEVLRRTDCCDTYLQGAEIRIGNSLENNGNNNPRCAVITVTGAVLMAFDCEMQGRYVNIILPQVSWILQFCEVKVYASASITGDNVAQRGIATQSAGPASATALPYLAIDKKPGLSQDTCTSVPVQDNPWWQLDLRSIYRITAVSVTSDFPCCSGNLDGAEIRIGLRNDTSNQRCAVVSIVGERRQYDYLCGVMEGRFVHVVLPGLQKNLTICDVQVFGTVLENVALRGVAFQSSSKYEKAGMASKVIDGYKFTHCSVTEDKPGQWVTVDLLVPYKVTVIQLAYISDCCFSDNVLVDNTRCQIISMSLEYLLTLDCGGAVGRYVTVIHPDVPSPLCEVEVYSTMVLPQNPYPQWPPRHDYCPTPPCNRDYILIKDEPKTWSEAQAYCRENYTDLATIDNAQDMNSVLDKMWNNLTDSWIGLYEDAVTWKWSLSDGDGEAEFTNWGVGEPSEKSGVKHCAGIQHTGDWKDLDCDSLQFFLCFDGTDGALETKVLVETQMKWTDARNYCREHHTDLLSVVNQTENQEVKSMLPGGKLAWIGLFGDSWRWSDGSYSSFRYQWQEPLVDLGEGPNCAYIYGRKWSLRSCDTKSMFICYYFKKRFAVRISTDFDVSDPVIHQQLVSQLETAFKSKGISVCKVHWTQSITQRQHSLQSCVAGGR